MVKAILVKRVLAALLSLSLGGAISDVALGLLLRTADHHAIGAASHRVE
jgi:hypothetical protein